MSLLASEIYHVPPMPAPLGSLALPVDVDLADALAIWRTAPATEACST